jgi:hypothetical protein
LKLEENKISSCGPQTPFSAFSVFSALSVFGFLGALVILGVCGVINNLLNLTEEPRKTNVAIISQKKALDMMQVV